MALFKYNAMDETGKHIKGRMEAGTEQDLGIRLKEEGKLLIFASEIQAGGSVKRLKDKMLADFCRQLGNLLGAGVSLVRAIVIISQEEGLKPQYKQLYENVLRQLRQGESLSATMVAQGEAFPELLVQMVRSAEASGHLDKTMLRMAQHYEKQYRLAAKVKSSMTYPKILSVLIVCVVVFIMVAIIPQFMPIFETMDELPVPTTILLALSDGVKNYWYLIVVAGLLLWMAFSYIGRLSKVRYFIDKAKVRMPLIGKLMQTIYTARFARTLSSLYSSGLPILSALQSAYRTIGNRYIESQFDQVIGRIRAGEALSACIHDVDGLLVKLSASVAVGEETGNLDNMLDSIADSLDYDADMALTRLTSYLEPVMIIVMAFVVGFILIAVMLPIFDSYSAIEQGASY